MKFPSLLSLSFAALLLPVPYAVAQTPAKAPAPNEPEKKSETKQAEEPLPKTVAAAVQHIVGKLSAEDKKRLRENKKEDLNQYHHGWGTGIRNGLGLWGKNPELLADCSLKLYGKKREIHPDRASGVIIEEVWTFLIKNPTK